MTGSNLAYKLDITYEELRNKSYQSTPGKIITITGYKLPADMVKYLGMPTIVNKENEVAEMIKLAKSRQKQVPIIKTSYGYSVPSYARPKNFQNNGKVITITGYQVPADAAKYIPTIVHKNQKEIEEMIRIAKTQKPRYSTFTQLIFPSATRMMEENNKKEQKIQVKVVKKEKGFWEKLNDWFKPKKIEVIKTDEIKKVTTKATPVKTITPRTTPIRSNITTITYATGSISPIKGVSPTRSVYYNSNNNFNAYQRNIQSRNPRTGEKTFLESLRFEQNRANRQRNSLYGNNIYRNYSNPRTQRNSRNYER